METLPRFGYLFLGIIGLIVSIIGGIFTIAVVDAIRSAYLRHPSRFKRAERLDSFQRKRLPELADTLGMEVVENVPPQLRDAIQTTVGTLGWGDVSDVLEKSYGDGKLCLCNIQKHLFRKHRFQGDNDMEWTQVKEYTCLVFMGAKQAELPNFTLTPNEHSLTIKLFNRRIFGKLQYEDDPEFHRRILIGTTEPDEVGPLLTPGVRDVLKKNADLRVAVCGSYIVVYDYGNIGKGIRFANLWKKDDGAIVDCEVVAAECWPQFYEAALEVIESLRQADSIRPARIS